MQAPRLFVPGPLEAGVTVALSADQAHKLLHVLRCKAGQRVLVFNGCDGEFAACLEMTNKACAALLGARTRAQTSVPDLRLMFAPLKRQANDWLVEKATELGVAALQPVLTQRCVAERIRPDRLRLIAQASAEQCERLEIPAVQEALTLSQALHAWPRGVRLLFADEAGDCPHADWGGAAGRAPPLVGALQSLGPQPAWGLLIGPEGGFTPQERAELRALPFVVPISLGPRILRAETAAIAGLSLMQALCGDWGSPYG